MERVSDYKGLSQFVGKSGEILEMKSSDSKTIGFASHHFIGEMWI